MIRTASGGGQAWFMSNRVASKIKPVASLPPYQSSKHHTIGSPDFLTRLSVGIHLAIRTVTANVAADD